MPLNPRAGKSPTPADLVNVPRLITAYYSEHPDVSQPSQKVSFGTSGHRGSAFDAAFNEDHILAITQAICEYRGRNGADGPLFLAADTHALSEPAFAKRARSAGGQRRGDMIDQDAATRPPRRSRTPSSTYNRRPAARDGLADGIVITPSHNPPEDGGFKYNPPHGGPADTAPPAGSRTAPTRFCATAFASVRRCLCDGAGGVHHASPRLHLGLRERSGVGGGLEAVRGAGSRWAPIRWAARAWLIGAASPNGTA